MFAGVPRGLQLLTQSLGVLLVVIPCLPVPQHMQGPISWNLEVVPGLVTCPAVTKICRLPAFEKY